MPYQESNLSKLIEFFAGAVRGTDSQHIRRTHYSGSLKGDEIPPRENWFLHKAVGKNKVKKDKDIGIAFYDYTEYEGGQRSATDPKNPDIGWTLKFPSTVYPGWTSVSVSSYVHSAGQNIPLNVMGDLKDILSAYGVHLEPRLQKNQIIFERPEIKTCVIFEVSDKRNDQNVHGTVQMG